MAPRPRDIEGEQYRKLFIGGITFNTTEKDLRDFYGQFGEIVDAVVMVHRGTNKSRGFGFVTFREPSMVDKAQAARPHLINGREVETKRATPREESTSPEAHQSVKKMFVANVKREHTEEQLRNYFASYGTVENVEIIKNSSGEPRGFGFVTFSDYDAVDKAILYKPHQIGNSRCDVKKAASKDAMKNKQTTNPPGGHDPYDDPHRGGPAYRERPMYGGYSDPYGPPPSSYGYMYPQDPYYNYPEYDRNDRYRDRPAHQTYHDTQGDSWGGYYDYPGYETGYRGEQNEGRRSEPGTGSAPPPSSSGVSADPRTGASAYYEDKAWQGSFEPGKYDDQGYAGGPARGGLPPRPYPGAQDPYARPPARGGYGREAGPPSSRPAAGYGAR